MCNPSLHATSGSLPGRPRLDWRPLVAVHYVSIALNIPSMIGLARSGIHQLFIN